MNKCYYRIVWENYPSDKTPLNEQNLNKIDVATDEMDNRIISLDSTKFDKSEAQLLVKYIEYDEDTGIFTITHYNGAKYTIDTLLEKLAINFDYDYQTQKLIIQLSDGEIKYVDLSALITQYEFVDSGTIAYTVYPDGRVTSEIKEGSIEERHLRPDYLADIKVEAAKADASAKAAAVSETNAKASENAAKASEIAAKQSEDNAAASETEAENSEKTAVQKAEEATGSAAKAKESQEAAKESEKNASESAKRASDDAKTATKKASEALESEINALDSEQKAESYAHGGTGTRAGEDTDNAKYYAEQAKESAEHASSIAGGNYLPLSGGTMDDNAFISLWANKSNDELIKMDSENGGYVGIAPNHIIISGGGLPDNGRESVLISLNDKAYLEANAEGGNLLLIAPDGTGWEIDAHDGGFRIFNYENNYTPAIIINKEGQVSFPKTATFSGYFDGELYSPIAPDGWRNVINAAGYQVVNIPVQQTYAGGMNWYMYGESHPRAAFGYYKDKDYYYFGINPDEPTGKIVAGQGYFNDNVAIKFGKTLYVRHIDGANSDVLYLNYTSRMPVHVGEGDGRLNVGIKATLETYSSAGNLQLDSVDGVHWAMTPLHDGHFRLMHIPIGGNSYIEDINIDIDNYWTEFRWRPRANGYLFNDDLNYYDQEIYADLGNLYFYNCLFPNSYAMIIRGEDRAIYMHGDLYIKDSLISTSDRNEKKDFAALDDKLIKDFIMGLIPLSYKFIENTSDRTHYGLISQDVEALMESLGMSSKDFAGLIKSPVYEEYETEEEVEVEKFIPDENGTPTPQKVKELKKVRKRRAVPGKYHYGLRYEEFIAPVIKFGQNLYRKYEAQQAEVKSLKKENQELKDRLARVEEALGLA